MITIRKGRLSDLQEIKTLEQLVWHEGNIFGKYGLSIFMRFGYVFIARNKKRIIGGIHGIKTHDNAVYVIDFFIDKDYHGQNIGTRLYKKLIRSVKLPIIAHVHADNEASLHIHEKLGFKIIKKEKDIYGIMSEDNYYLMKRL